MPLASVVVVATGLPIASFSTTVTPGIGVSPMLSLLVSSSTLPVIVPGLATMPASQLRSVSPESSTVWAVLPSIGLASLSLASLPTLAVVKL